ncbi:50S ribosomal protein L23 [bacterium]|nr:50S ribosomal protein L23 [bacterium]|tara:strand:+ start:9313 stop:9624 length:312 start_codon:yes stop_codon:yes gene_type:complete
MIALSDVLIKPIISEKTMDLAMNENAYTFQISARATKTDVRDAVKKELKIKKVLSVRILKNPGKKRARRTSKGGVTYGQTSRRIKAIVRIASDEDLMSHFQPG